MPGCGQDLDTSSPFRDALMSLCPQTPVDVRMRAGPGELSPSQGRGQEDLGPLPCPGDVLAAGMSQAPAGKAEEGRIRPFPPDGEATGCRVAREGVGAPALPSPHSQLIKALPLF